MTATRQHAASRRRARRAGRTTRGQFIRTHDRLTLYRIVADVARLAAERLKKSATDITVKEWNAHRRYLKYVWPDIPRTHEICRQLADGSGRPFPWAALLHAALDEALNLAMFDAARRSIPDQPTTRERACSALQLVARLLGRDTVLPDEYASERSARMETARRRDAHEERALGERLPTLGQILSLYDQDWDAAIADAGLAPRPPMAPPPRPDSRRRPVEDILSWIERYTRWLNGRPSVNQRWREFAKLNSGAPSIGALEKRGGLQTLVSEVNRSDKRERLADREVGRKARVAAGHLERGKTLHARPGRRSRQVLDLVTATGPMSTLEIAGHFGISREAARQALAHLRRLGLVEPTMSPTQQPGQKYRAIPSDGDIAPEQTAAVPPDER
ncbi:MAG: hypothetical protein ACRDQZ_09535 [Mycobacteriales bacterium]